MANVHACTFHHCHIHFPRQVAVIVESYNVICFWKDDIRHHIRKSSTHNYINNVAACLSYTTATAHGSWLAFMTVWGQMRTLQKFERPWKWWNSHYSRAHELFISQILENSWLAKPRKPIGCSHGTLQKLQFSAKILIYHCHSDICSQHMIYIFHCRSLETSIILIIAVSASKWLNYWMTYNL